MSITSVMKADPVTVEPQTSLLDVQTLMQDRGIHHLLVVEGDDLQGVISDRDILRALSPFLNTYTEQSRDVATLACPARDFMTTDPVTVHRDVALEDAADLMLKHDISSLPVLDDDGHLCGILTSHDILRHTRRQRQQAPA